AGVVPDEPREASAVRADPRAGDEVGAADEHDRLLAAVGDVGDGDDLVAGLLERRTVGGAVGLADADDPPPVRRHDTVGVAVPVAGGRLDGDGSGRGVGRPETPDALVVPRREPHGAVIDPPGPTAVLVDAGACRLARRE